MVAAKAHANRPNRIIQPDQPGAALPLSRTESVVGAPVFAQTAGMRDSSACWRLISTDGTGTG